MSHQQNWLDRCHFGDVSASMRAMIADGVKVQTIITSPPYWGLRSYLPGDHPDKHLEIGQEPTLREFIDKLVGVFDLCRELLTDDGTAWINMGDAYANDGKWGGSTGGKHAAGLHGETGVGRGKRNTGLKPKDLMGQPWRLAFALQDAGWYLRQDIIWHKPNPMPESTRDRCTKAHEYLFLLSKSPRYYYDQAAIRTQASAKTTQLSYDTFDGDRRAGYKMPDGWNTGTGAHGSFHPKGREKGHVAGNVNPAKGALAYEAGDVHHRTKSGLLAYAKGTRAARDNFKRPDSKRAIAHPGQTMGTHRPDRADSEYDLTTANRRSVWTIATEAYPDSHFATFPEKLVEPCVLAGSRGGDTVFDPFFGSGTTGAVAQRLGRRFIGCELNRDNDTLQRDRLRFQYLPVEVMA
jgi:DNA modification methylase